MNPLVPTAEIGVTPPSEKLAAVINGTVIPQLRKDFSAMKDLQEFWLYNDIAAKVEQAAKEQSPLAGYAPDFWVEVGTVFAELMRWLDTPIAGLGGKTPRAVLGRDYIKVTAE